MATAGHRLSVSTLLCVVRDVARFVAAMCRPRAALAAENLFLRKQLALYIERQAKPRRADDATRIALVALSRLVDWRRLLTIVKPDTLIRWHRTGFSAVLALEIKAPRTAARAGGAAAADQGHRPREPNVG